jgi:predicted acylesterase/phospholipase RssA
MIPAMRVARKPDSAHGTEPGDRRAPRALRATALAAAVLVSACTSFGVIDNKPLLSGEDRPGYTLETFNRTLNQRSDELSLAVAFSGGGTRAAALAYGVMQELRDTRVRLQGTERSLLEAVNVISSVSGGSFTSAYYGLYGNRLFEDFEARFLRRNIEGALLRSLFNPLQWFSSHDRTETAVSYYKENLFGEATFSDLIRKNAPLILINTSDLASGERFTFSQEYFDLLCSDLNSFSLARAVTASSAVPVVFDPVVVENYSGCSRRPPAWLTAARQRDANNPNLAMVVRDNETYQDKVRHRYAQFVDGGITDNLGLRAMLDTDRAGRRRAAVPEGHEHPGAAAHRVHLGQRSRGHAPGHRRHEPRPLHREHAERGHQHPAAPLQRGHAAADAAKRRGLGQAAVDPAAPRDPVFHPPELRQHAGRAAAPLSERDPHQLRAERRTGGPADRHRA